MLFAGGGLVEQASRCLSRDPLDPVAAMIEQLRAAGYVYEGRLPPPKGASIEDWEDREQTLFRSSQFGDDVDPSAEEVRRQLHLFRVGHRLSQEQDRSRLSCR